MSFRAKLDALEAVLLLAHQNGNCRSTFRLLGETGARIGAGQRAAHRRSGGPWNLSTQLLESRLQTCGSGSTVAGGSIATLPGALQFGGGLDQKFARLRLLGAHLLPPRLHCASRLVAGRLERRGAFGADLSALQ